jgi:phage tail sheath gpL-like
MADTSLLIHVDQTDPLNRNGREGNELVRAIITHLQGVLSGAKRASTIKVWPDGADPVQASGTVTCASVAAADTVTINGVVLTASSTPSGEAQFEIDGTDAQDAAALAAIINAHSTLQYVVSASAAASGVVTITALQPGVIGNAITLASSNGTRAAVSGARLANGAGSAVAPITVTI